MPPRLPLADPGSPDTRGPGRYIWWLVTRQPLRVLRGSFFGTAWTVGLTVPPYLISRAIDDGLRRDDRVALMLWVAAVVAAGILNAFLSIMRHRTMTFVREDAALRTVQLLIRQAARVGAALPRRVGSGEVVSAGVSDVSQVAMVLTIAGPGVGGLIGYAVVAVLLWYVSPVLAALVLLGVPAVTVLIGPLLRRLERVESAYRTQQGELTARAGDVVAGLRILSGIGGTRLFASHYAERSAALRAEGYRVGRVASWVEALAVGVPALFLALVTWLTARMAASGAITVGEMVAVYGYAAMLVIPVAFFIEGSYDLTRGRVAARRIINVLRLAPDIADHADPVPGPIGQDELHDPESGLTLPPGILLGLAADDPADAITLADRLGRYADSPATWGGIPLARVSLAEVRSRILVAEPESYLFAGTLRDLLASPADRHNGGPDAIAALHAASADDIVDGLPAGLDSAIDTQARSLSGGQRQRVRLARALLAAPDVLILLDPTSAVDAHTEARIADRLHVLRAGRTTLVASTSPLLLARADRVAYLAGGRVAATGTHAELMAREPGYRALVSRGLVEQGDDNDVTVAAR